MKVQRGGLIAVLGLVVTLLLSGVSLLRAADQAAATDFMQKRDKLDMRDPVAMYTLGTWAEQHNMPGEASDLYRKVLKLRPEDDDCYKRLVYIGDTLRPTEDAEPQADLKKEFGDKFSIHVAPHWIVIYNTDKAWALNRAVLLEKTHDVFYQSFRKAGFRALPLEKRLVCVLFQEHTDFAAYAKRVDHADLGWSSGYYSSRTNRIAFFNDESSPKFAEVEQQIAALDKTIADLAEQLRAASHNTALASQYRKQLDAARDEQRRLRNIIKSISGLTNAGKTTHEATHQLAYNSGLHEFNVMYPFWLVEGLATNFEAADPTANFGPHIENTSRRKMLKECMAANRLPTFNDLLVVTKPPTENLQLTNDLYNESWALFQFVYKKHQDQLRTYVQNLAKGPKGPRTEDQLRQDFRTAFGQIGDIEFEWRLYTKSAR